MKRFFEPVQEKSSVITKSLIIKKQFMGMPGLARPEPVQARLGQPRNGLGPRRVFFEPVQKQTLPWASWSIKGIPLPNCSTKGFPSMAVLPAQLPAQPGPPEPLTSFFLNRFKKQLSVIKKTGPGPMGQGMPGHGF